MRVPLFNAQRRFVIAIAAVTIAVAGLVWTLGQTRPSKEDDPRSPEAALKRQPTLFHGRVVDQDGNALDGVEIVVQIAELVGNQVTPGMISPRQETLKRFSVYARDGKFGILCPHGYNQVEIERVVKEGYEWVFDWAWQVQPDTRNNNRVYRLPGRFWRCPYYEPDSERPIIIPMHRIGDPNPPRTVSRGGADVDCNGKKTINEPVPIHVPSAGPGAPKTDEELAARLQEYINKAREAEKARAKQSP
jgi:hypothetical protein